MRRSFLLFMMLITLLVSGCLPQAQITPTPTTTVKPTPVPTTGLSLPAEPVVPVKADCTVVTLKPTPGPTAESIYPPITEADWTKGPSDARVTILEYGDFQ